MTTLLSLHSLSKSFGTQELFRDISFTVRSGDRIGLLGQNGSGKTTLLKILMGYEEQDAGTITKKQQLRLGLASQAPQFSDYDVETVLLREKAHGSERERKTRALSLLTRAGFGAHDTNAATLSGGWKKRLDIVRALMDEPELLLLDEPTNHLDIEGITWLENFLLKERLSYIIVSHDRYFLENMCTKIIELDKSFPNGIFASDGGYAKFLEHKLDFLEAQRQQEKGLQASLRPEQAWLKKSPKARTTKSRSRIAQAYEMMEELAVLKRRNAKSQVSIEFTASERETRKLLSTKNLTKSLGGKELFKNITLTLSPGSRLGIVGKNGTGKTTLLKILSGGLSQDSGTIKYADNLRCVYFDQHREEIAPDITLREALSPTGEFVTYRGQPIHVNGWAKKFLFSPDRLSLPVQYLSGGERARILIARLILEPADILFLDEPTNDLDISTLEVIEESLLSFAGAVVLITHDRCLMDRVCTQIIGLGEGKEEVLFAEYAQWVAACSSKSEKKETKISPRHTPPAPPQKKLTYKDQRELDGMESEIGAVENEIALLEKELNLNQEVSLYQKLAEAEKRRDALYERWHYLEGLKKT